MIKRILATVFAVMVVVSASAQVEFGAKVGVNLSTVLQTDVLASTLYSGGDLEFDGRSSLGFVVGGTFAVDMSDKVLFSTELLFSQEGFRVSQSGDSNKARYSTYHLNVPILFKFPLGESKKLSIATGVQLGFLTIARCRYAGDSDSVRSELGYKTFNVALPVALAYRVSERIELDARYNFGLTNIYEEGLADEGFFSNCGLAITVGYKF